MRTPSLRRIAFCITDLDPGGAEKGLYQLATRLSRDEWEPRIYCLGPEAALSDALRQEGIGVECYGARSCRDLGVLIWLKTRLKEFRPDLLQGFLFHGNMVARVAGRWAGVPVILAGHRVAEREKLWHLCVDRWTKRLVDHHVCVSRGVAEHVRTHLHLRPGEITVIPNGVAASAPAKRSEEVKTLRELSSAPAGAPIVLAVGRLHPQKGFLNLMNAFQLLLEHMPESRLVIVGEGPERPQLEARRRELGLEDRICLPGHRNNVPELMRQASLLALTSRWEGMPNVILEAMSVGLPVVSMEVEGIRDVIDNERLGIIVTQGDVKEFGRAMLRVLSHPELALSLAKAAQDHALREFTFERMVQNYERLYRNLMQREVPSRES